ncbi:hypothetical protein ABE096_03210 [Robertmurraya massiliosenegalensis]|uniref:hypothetical protein n=1 Tax=Robertmurraya massiliosenegalensis TaxID=1287657 RepID=UPI003D2BCFCA
MEETLKLILNELKEFKEDLQNLKESQQEFKEDLQNLREMFLVLKIILSMVLVLTLNR